MQGLRRRYWQGPAGFRIPLPTGGRATFRFFDTESAAGLLRRDGAPPQCCDATTVVMRFVPRIRAAGHEIKGVGARRVLAGIRDPHSGDAMVQCIRVFVGTFRCRMYRLAVSEAGVARGS